MARCDAGACTWRDFGFSAPPCAALPAPAPPCTLRRYEGEVREFEVGVLASDDSPIATECVRVLQAAGFATRLNEPWSGKRRPRRAPSPAFSA